MPTLRFFASLREAAGVDRVVVDAPTAGAAIAIAGERFGAPFTEIARRCAVVVGDTQVPPSMVHDTEIGPDDEVALLPPVSGGAEMIDVGGKEETRREAVAGCTLRTSPETAARILSADLPKGDAVATARVAGVLAVKRTPELIPLCHPVRTTSATIEIEAGGAPGEIDVRASVRGVDRTGFEMEALLAASTAALTIYDMSKAIDPAMRIDGLRLLSKSGGKSGDVQLS